MKKVWHLALAMASIAQLVYHFRELRRRYRRQEPKSKIVVLRAEGE